MDIVGTEEVADAAVAVVSSSMSYRVLSGRPCGTGMGLELHRPQFVEANYDRALRRPLVESVDPFFFAAKSGSFDSFQVRVRW